MKPKLNDTIHYIDAREKLPRTGKLIYINGCHMVTERADGFRDYVHRLTTPSEFDFSDLTKITF